MRWQRGWKLARTQGGGIRRFWRGPVTLTLSDADATRLEALVTELGISSDQIVADAVRSWLAAYTTGARPAPLTGTRTWNGSRRQKGVYYTTAPDPPDPTNVVPIFPRRPARLPPFPSEFPPPPHDP